jgi:hypothetical protein
MPETKRNVIARPITLLICSLCLIGLSASTTYLIVRNKNQSRLDYVNQKVLTLEKNNKSLADRNTELMNSLQKLQNEHSELESRYKDINRFNQAKINDRQLAIYLQGLSILTDKLRTSSCAKRYYNQFDIDAEEVVTGGQGPDIWYSTGHPRDYAQYLRSFGYILLYDKAFADPDAMAHTLAHELGHWANKISGKNPDLSYNKCIKSSLFPQDAKSEPPIGDGKYGYGAELAVFGSIRY